MSFKPIRTFLKARLLSLDPKLIEHKDAFNTENIGDNKFSNAFHISYGPVATSTANQTVTNDIVTATVTLCKKGTRDPQVAYDDAMDFANLFRLECLKPKHTYSQSFIKLVKCDSITPEQVPTNDNSFVIRLQFSISVIFGIGVDLQD